MRRPVYKVVNKDRSSFNFNSSYKSNNFLRVYNKSEIITGEENSLGIFCFKRKSDAIDFVKNYCKLFMYDFLILKVGPIGKGKVPKIISNCADKYDLDLFYKDYTKITTKKPPEGTICYPSVKVLE